MVNKNNKLPDTLGECLSLALNDIKKCEIEGMRINMGIWLKAYYSNEETVPEECQVCLAGAVMYQTLRATDRYKDRCITPGGKFGLHIVPSIMCEITEEDTFDKLTALNSIRGGYVRSSLETFYFPIASKDKELQDRVKKFSEENAGFIPTEYSEDREMFYNSMREMSQKLIEAGL